MDENLRKVVRFLNRDRVRATYKAVGEAIGLTGFQVGNMLGPRRPATSWVVNSESEQPSGYEPNDLHQDLLNEPVITDGVELLRRMAGIRLF
jgi:hypothetical protein